MKSFACKDVGVQCEWRTTGTDDNEVLTQVSKHASDKHGFKEMSVEMINKVKGAIRNVSDDRERERDIGAA